MQTAGKYAAAYLRRGYENFSAQQRKEPNPYGMGTGLSPAANLANALPPHTV